MPRLALVKIDIMPTPPRSADHGRRHPAVAVAPKKTTSLLPCIGMPDDRKPLREISAWELAGRTTNRRLGVQRTLRRPRTSDTTASTKDAFFKLTVDASASSLYHRPVQAGATTTALQRPVSSITRIEMRTHHQMPAPVTRIDVKSHASVDEEHDAHDAPEPQRNMVVGHDGGERHDASKRSELRAPRKGCPTTPMVQSRYSPSTGYPADLLSWSERSKIDRSKKH